MIVKIRTGEREVHIESDLSLAETIEQAFEVLSRLGGEANRHATSSKTPNTQDHSTIDLSINAVVSRLGSGSARAILKAAAIHLSLVDNKPTFSREEISARAREARDWQLSYNSNQSRDLRRMVESREIIEKAGGNFSLPTKALDESRRMLVDE